MLNAANTGAGQSVGTPDVCNTPTGSGVDVPTPYTNTAMHAQATNAAKTVFVGMASGLNQGSVVSTSNGDESGTTHPTTRGAQTFSAGNPIVFVGGLPGINVSSLTSHNAGNCPLGSVALAGSTTVFYTRLDTRRADGLPPLGEAIPVDEARLAALELPRRSVVHLSRTPDGEGVVALGVLTSEAASELEAALCGPLAGVRRLVLDLSESPGGSLDGAIRVAGMFVPTGTLLAVRVEADGDRVSLVGGRALPWAMALEVRVSARTASAAEVLAGSLQQLGRAAVVGERTYGKGTTQRVASLEGRLHLATVGEVLLPDGARIDGVGVVPR